MSFDVFLVAFRDGKNAPADRDAARAVLSRHNYLHDPESDHYRVELSDGSSFSMYSEGLDGGTEVFNGGMIVLHGISPAICDFIFEFGRAANCAILPAMEPACVLLSREDLARHLPASLTDNCQQVVVADGAEVRAALGGGYAAWRAYRDHVVRQYGENPEQ